MPARRIIALTAARAAALALVLAAILLLPAPAGAQPAAADPDLPAPDPPGVWRRLTHDDATSTSRCIGNPVTPLCAVETYLACFFRSRNDYCFLVEAGVQTIEMAKKRADSWREYRVVYARRPSKLDPVEPRTEGPLKPLPGDVLIALHSRRCYGTDGKHHCSIGVEEDPPGVYMLRKQGEIWTNPYFFRPRF